MIGHFSVLRYIEQGNFLLSRFRQVALTEQCRFLLYVFESNSDGYLTHSINNICNFNIDPLLCRRQQGVCA